jgi:hypothetical protein
MRSAYEVVCTPCKKQYLNIYNCTALNITTPGKHRIFDNEVIHVSHKFQNWK